TAEGKNRDGPVGQSRHCRWYTRVSADWRGNRDWRPWLDVCQDEVAADGDNPEAGPRGLNRNENNPPNCVKPRREGFAQRSALAASRIFHHRVTESTEKRKQRTRRTRFQ